MATYKKGDNISWQINTDSPTTHQITIQPHDFLPKLKKQKNAMQTKSSKHKQKGRGSSYTSIAVSAKLVVLNLACEFIDNPTIESADLFLSRATGGNAENFNQARGLFHQPNVTKTGDLIDKVVTIALDYKEKLDPEYATRLDHT